MFSPPPEDAAGTDAAAATDSSGIPGNRKRGRPSVGAADGATFRGPVMSSHLSVDDELAAIARRIAADMGTSFDDPESTSKVDMLEAAVMDVRHRLSAAEAELAAAWSNSSATAAGAAGAATAAPAVANTATIKELRSALESLEMKAARASAAAEQRFRRNVRDTVLRVTLQKDVSDINERTGGGAGGAGSSSDLLYVQPPSIVCANETCRNSDETLFRTDFKAGDVTCMKCGTIAMEHMQYDGDWTRSFEGEDSTSQIGDRPNALLSNSHNLRTAMRLSAGVSKEKLRQLKLVQEVVEMNQYVYGADANERRTREGYKDKQKQKAFEKLSSTGDRLHFSTGVVDRGKAFFAAFRDNREHVTSLEESIAACLVAAVEVAMQQTDTHSESAAASTASSSSSSSSSSLKQANAAAGQSLHNNSSASLSSSTSFSTSLPSSSNATAPLSFVSSAAPSTTPAAAAAGSSASSASSSLATSAPPAASNSAASTAASAAAAAARRDRDAQRQEDNERKRRALVRGRMLDLAGPAEDEEGAEPAADPSSSSRAGGPPHRGGFEKFSILPAEQQRQAQDQWDAQQRRLVVVGGSSGIHSVVASAAAVPVVNVGGRATAVSGDSWMEAAPPTVSDAFVDELYARAGEREQNPDIEERDEYKAPS